MTGVTVFFMVLFYRLCLCFSGIGRVPFPVFFVSKPVNNYTFEILGRHIREDGAAILIVFDRLIGIKYGRGRDWVNLQEKGKKMKKVIKFGNARKRIGACICGKGSEYTKYGAKKKPPLYVDRHGIPGEGGNGMGGMPQMRVPELGAVHGRKERSLI